MTIKEMMIYVDVAIEKIEEEKNLLTKENLLNELTFLAYHCNKKDVLLKRNITKEEFILILETCSSLT